MLLKIMVTITTDSGSGGLNTTVYGESYVMEKICGMNLRIQSSSRNFYPSTFLLFSKSTVHFRIETSFWSARHLCLQKFTPCKFPHLPYMVNRTVDFTIL